VTYGPSSWDSGHYQQQQQPPQRSGYRSRQAAPTPPAEPAALAWVAVRIEAILRMQRVSYNHALTATADRPQGRLPGPHALALLFAAPGPAWTPDRPNYKLATASRMFPWTDDRRPGYNVRDADALLETMTKIAATEHNAGPWDPLTITDRTETLSQGAEFVGIGLSSLGDPVMNWGGIKPRAFGLDLPAHCDVYLLDGTWIEIGRERHTWTMKSNKTLGYLTGFDAVGRSIPPDYEPRPGSTHAWLQALVNIVDRAYQEPRMRGHHR